MVTGTGLCQGGNSLLGCVGGTVEEPDEQTRDSVRINKQIEDELNKEKRKLRNQIKILLLGCGEAGKSTFIKQMRIIHSSEEEGGWTVEEREQYRREILMNVIQCLQILLEEMTGSLDASLNNTATRLKELKPDQEKDQAKLWEYRDNIQAIWEETAIQETYKRRNEFNLPDCCRYFLTNISRLSAPDFIPESKDILQIRVMTTGVIEYNFDMDGKECIMIDVGGQRTERKKWIHCFEDVLLVMFLAAASEYDQVLEEDHTENRMEESLNLFRTILSYHWFKNSAIALFLNKKDLLEEKIQTSHLEDYFPKFKEFKTYKQQDYDAAMGFIKHMFNQQKKEVEASRHYQDSNTDGYTRSFFVHETMATDTDNIKRVFGDVKKTIMDIILRPFAM